jgi:predicted RNA binding protein YcfA (HicA-like mRNA interferase family)
MKRLGNVPHRKVVRALQGLGFLAVRQRGSHVRFVHADGRSTTVPRHSKEPIGPQLLKRIASSLGVDEAAFLDAFRR